jgi:general secretion pathway protein G
MQNVTKRRSALQRGFTLVEIMVVVVIIGVLGALVVPKLLNRTSEARVTAARTDISSLMQALKLYKLDNQRYPTTEQGLKSLVEKPTSGPQANGWKTGGYVDKLPNDPWGNPYQYLYPGVKGEVDIFSLGADGQPGGVDADADVGSWE